MRRALSLFAALMLGAGLAVAASRSQVEMQSGISPSASAGDERSFSRTPAAAGTPGSKKRFAVPQGPIQITSQHADFDERGKRMLYRGGVRLVSQELELLGERLELRQPGKGLYEAHVTGRPARLIHAGAAGVPPLSASASQIVYNTQAATVALSGGVQLERGTDVLTGETIRYNAASRRIQASGANGGQVKIVIQPPPGKDKKK